MPRRTDQAASGPRPALEARVRAALDSLKRHNSQATARRVGKDALRELTSATVTRRLATKRRGPD